MVHCPILETMNRFFEHSNMQEVLCLEESSITCFREWRQVSKQSLSPLWKVFHEIPLMLSWVCFFHRGSKISRWFWSFFTEAPKFLSAFDQSLIFYRFKSKCEVIAGGFVIKHTNSRHFRQYLDRLLPSGWQCGPNYSTWPYSLPRIDVLFFLCIAFYCYG